jgi:cell fate regulator YaaT (PSP1 superfamily)
VFDWLAGVPLPSGVQTFDGVEIRFKHTRKAFFRNTTALQLMPGDLVTVDAAPGFDVGMVSLAGELVRAQMERRKAGTETYELKRILRKSTQEDIDSWHAARKREDETLFAVRGMARHAGLDMKVSDVEYQADGTKATVYYTCEERVDFRGLVRQMADRFKVRVEMKQVGARQEAGRIGGIGSCGRELCCSTWLTDFRSVTTSAARYQQLALNPQKLAGQCGKLKCCLNYELDMYIEAVKRYPSPKPKLKTNLGNGAHMKTDIFLEKMWYMFKRPGEPMTMLGLPVEQVRDIQLRNKEGEVVELDLAQLQAEAEPKAKGPDYENVVGQDDLTRFDSKQSGKRKRSGKQAKGGGRGARQGAPAGASGTTAPATSGDKPRDGAQRTKRRKGGRRRERPGKGPADKPQAS